MSITLGDILRSNLLPNIEVLNTVPNFADIPVELTSTQSIYELPIGHFIKAHELVFSSSIGLAEEEDAYMTFIREISEGGGSGIIMAFKQADYRPSERLLSHAAALQMPLFIIPWEHRFLDMQLAIANMLRSDQEREFNELQATLLSMFFHAQSLDDAAEAIAKKLRRSILIADRDGKTVGRSEKSSSTGEFPLTMAIENQQETVGFLTLGEAPVNETPDADILRRYVCFPLMLWFFRKNVEEQATTQLKNDFVWNLANERYSSLEEAVQQGRLLNLDLTKSYTCLLLELQYDNAFTPGIIPQQHSVQRLFEAVAKEMHLQLMLSSYGSQFILYLEYRNAPEYAPEHFIDLVTPSLAEQFPGSKLFWGISESSYGTTDFSAAHKHALQALSYALRSKKQRYRFTYHDTKEAQITNLLSQNAALQEEAFAVIEKLVKYSDPSGIDLFGTLQMFMECNYNISQTARNLYIHRQSLLYRLSKIEELTDMSLHDHRSLFLLDIYAHIYAGY